MIEAGDFWTAEEVAVYLRIPQSTVYKLAQDKILPGFKVGKHWRFRRETILEWIKTREENVLSFFEENKDKPKSK